MTRAYFHARSIGYVFYMFIQPVVERVLLDARGIAASRPKS